MAATENKAAKLFDLTIDWCFKGAAFLIAAMMVIVTYDVIARYFFTRPNIWAMPLTEYILVYATFLAAPLILKNEGHIVMDIAVSRFRPKTALILGVITSLIGVTVCVVLLWQGSKELAYSFARGTITLIQPWRITEWPTLVAVPFGSLLLSIQFLRRTYGFLSALRKQRGDSLNW